VSRLPGLVARVGVHRNLLACGLRGKYSKASSIVDERPS
jgi:hypothetical protein